MLKELLQPNEDVHAIFTRIAKAVFLATKGTQCPVWRCYPAQFLAFAVLEVYVIVYFSTWLTKIHIVSQHWGATIMRENGCILNSILPASTKETKLRAELEAEFQAKIAKKVRAARIAIAKQMLDAITTTVEATRERAPPLAAYLETLVADEVLRESCGDAIESAKKLLAKLQAQV